MRMTARVVAATRQNNSKFQNSAGSASNGRLSTAWQPTRTAAYTASTVPETASAKSTASQSVRRFARCSASKKSIAAPTGSGERDFHWLPLDRALDLPEPRFDEAPPAGDQRYREALAARVVRGHRVVVGLPRERDLVLRRGQLLGELVHGGVRFEIRIGLREREHAPQGAPEHRLGADEVAHRRRVAGLGGGALRSGAGLVARLDHCFQRLALVLQIALRGLDQVRDQVVPALELHVDLRERVLVPVAQVDQTVVGGHGEQDHQHGGREDDPSDHTFPLRTDGPGTVPLPPRGVQKGATACKWGIGRPCFRSVGGGSAALFQRQMTLLVLLPRPARAGIVPADAGSRADDGRGLPLRRRALASGGRRIAVRLDGLLLAPL